MPAHMWDVTDADGNWVDAVIAQDIEAAQKIAADLYPSQRLTLTQIN